MVGRANHPPRVARYNAWLLGPSASFSIEACQGLNFFNDFAVDEGNSRHSDEAVRTPGACEPGLPIFKRPVRI